MKLLTLAAVLTFGSLAALSAQEAEKNPEKLLEELRSELRAELKAAAEKDDDSNNRVMRLRAAALETLATGSLDKKEQQVLSALVQIQASSHSEKVGALCQQLTESLQASMQQRQKEFKEAYTAALIDALRTAFKATKASELDAPLMTVARLVKEANALVYSGGTRANAAASPDQATAVQYLLTQMQEVMLAAQAGRPSVDRLEGILSSYGGPLSDLMPRSEIAEGIQAVRARYFQPAPKRTTAAENEARIREMIRSVKKLEDLPAAVDRMEAMITQVREAGGSVSETALVSTFRSYQKTYAELKNGISTSATLTASPTTSTASGMADLASIRGLLLRYALPRALALGADRGPKENENIAGYLNRIVEEARQAADWPLLVRTLEVARTVEASLNYSTNDGQGLRLLLAGINYERAQRYEYAVASYFAALNTGSQVVPSEWIGEKLAAIQKAEPRAYEAGSRAQAINEADTRPKSGASSSTRPVTNTALPAPVLPAPAPAPAPAAPPAPVEQESKKPAEAPKENQPAAVLSPALDDEARAFLIDVQKAVMSGNFASVRKLTYAEGMTGSSWVLFRNQLPGRGQGETPLMRDLALAPAGEAGNAARLDTGVRYQRPLRVTHQLSFTYEAAPAAPVSYKLAAAKVADPATKTERWMLIPEHPQLPAGGSMLIEGDKSLIEEDAQSSRFLAHKQALLQNRAEAEEAIAKSQRIPGQPPSAYGEQHLGWACFYLGDNQRALAHFKAAYELEAAAGSQGWHAEYSYAIGLMANGQVAEAVKRFDHVSGRALELIDRKSFEESWKDDLPEERDLALRMYGIWRRTYAPPFKD